MDRIASRLRLAAGALLLVAACAGGPFALDAARQIMAQDDPVRLADLALDTRFDAALAAREMEAALSAGDPELAQSFLELADARKLVVSESLRARVIAAKAKAATASHAALRFAGGFLVGEPDDLASLAGTVTGDLFVYGDLRDAVRETTNLVRGKQVDELILGLACVGLAVSAGTYATLGAGAPARIGVSVIKAAGKTGRMTIGMTQAVIHPLRAAVNTAALRRAFAQGVLVSPAAAIRTARAAVKLDKAEGLVRVLSDVGRINAKTGTRGALDALKLADNPKDLARLARLAEAKGGQTRAVLKVLGRGAIMLTKGLLELASWLIWALFNLLSLIVALKRMTERTTLRAIRWRKRTAARRLATAALPG